MPHALTLMGREGKPGERPAVSSFSEADRRFIDNFSGHVPPLASEVFLQRWGPKTAAQLVARFLKTRGNSRFKLSAGLTNDESIVDITAFVLQVNGAGPGSQRLTRTTEAIVNTQTSDLGFALSSVSRNRGLHLRPGSRPEQASQLIPTPKLRGVNNIYRQVLVAPLRDDQHQSWICLLASPAIPLTSNVPFTACDIVHFWLGGSSSQTSDRDSLALKMMRSSSAAGVLAPVWKKRRSPVN